MYVLKGGTGTLISGSPQFVAGLAWYKGALYVSGGSFTGPKTSKWQLLKWSGENGTTFTKRQAIYTAPKTFAGFNGLAFGGDGRLYVGVDVGLTNGNDHGPARTPYVYDILSIKPNGKGLKVFATGIRQPWQLAFLNGSSSPYVSDLGQDSGAKNPPDFVLRVKQATTTASRAVTESWPASARASRSRSSNSGRTRTSWAWPSLATGCT